MNQPMRDRGMCHLLGGRESGVVETEEGCVFAECCGLKSALRGAANDGRLETTAGSGGPCVVMGLI